MTTSRFFLLSFALLVVLTVSLSVVTSYNMSQAHINNCKVAYAYSHRTPAEINAICNQ